MKLRIVVVEPEESIRESLALFLRSLGHEVMAVAEPDLCPIYHDESATCPQENPCGDILLIGQHLPKADAFRFIQARIVAGCKGLVENMAVICGPWERDARFLGRELGCRVFRTPMKFSDLQKFVDEVASRTDPRRRLAAVD